MKVVLETPSTVFIKYVNLFIYQVTLFLMEESSSFNITLKTLLLYIKGQTLLSEVHTQRCWKEWQFHTGIQQQHLAPDVLFICNLTLHYTIFIILLLSISMTVICMTLRGCLNVFLVLKQGEMSTAKRICTYFWRFRNLPDELHSSQEWDMLNHCNSRGNQLWKHLEPISEPGIKTQGSSQARTCP